MHFSLHFCEECVPWSLLCSEATPGITGTLCTCSQKLAGMIQEGIRTPFMKGLPHFWASQERGAFVGIGSWQKTSCFYGIWCNSTSTSYKLLCKLCPPWRSWRVCNSASHGAIASITFVCLRHKIFFKEYNFPMVLLHDSEQPAPGLFALFKGNVNGGCIWGSNILWPEAGVVFIGKNTSQIWRGNCVLKLMFHALSWPTVTSQGFKYCTKSQRYSFLPQLTQGFTGLQMLQTPGPSICCLFLKQFPFFQGCFTDQ